MIDFKLKLAELLSNYIDLDVCEIKSLIEIPPLESMGDYSFPCFKLSKIYRKSPIEISKELKDKIKLDLTLFDKCEVIDGYINFFLNKEILAKQVLTNIYENQKNYGSDLEGLGKNIVIDYSSPNIAKPFHIGHLRSTVIGRALYNVYKYLNYNTISVNHIGDYGTQFGKIIEGIKLWGKEYDIENNPIEELTKIYVRIEKLCEEDENVLNDCRNNFKKLEDKEEMYVNIWKKIIDLSLKEFNKIYDMLEVKFDSYNGESFYADKTKEVIDRLNSSGKLKDSLGAKVIDLSEFGIIAPCIIVKNNGSTTYATRDLAAILYRSRTYDYFKNIYITAYEQEGHFKQVFEVAKYLGIDKKYIDGLVHVPFGMVRLKTGKLSTREGNVIKLEDLLNESIRRAKKIIETKNPNLKNKDEVAKQVGISAIVFNDLYSNRIKDEVFDWDEILNFQGETGPYIQYMYVRTRSILSKSNLNIDLSSIDFSVLNNSSSSKVVILLSKFNEILKEVIDKNEPSILSRYLIHLAQSFSVFYNENKILVEEDNIKNPRLLLTFAVDNVLEKGSHLLGLTLPLQM